MLEWEQGILKIPRKEWSSFKREILNTYNSIVELDFRIAKHVHTLIQNNSKNKRGYNFRREAVIRITQANLNWDSIRRIEKSLFHGEQYTSRKIFKPKKKDFAIATNKSSFLDLGVSKIYFDNKNRAIKWTVLEDIYAVTRAKEHKVVKHLFNLLDTMPWTKNTGGIITGNTQILENSIPGNYVTYTFGPLGTKLFSQILNTPNIELNL